MKMSVFLNLISRFSAIIIKTLSDFLIENWQTDYKMYMEGAKEIEKPKTIPKKNKVGGATT